MLLARGDGAVLAANRSVAQLPGLSGAYLAGKNIAAVAVEASDDIARLLRSWSRSSNLLPGSLTFLGENGERTLCRCEGAALQAGTAERPAVVVIRLIRKSAAVARFMTLNRRIEDLTVEVSRRRRAEQALAAQREWLRVTLESIGDAVIAADMDGRITFMNSVACGLTGSDAAKAVGEPLEDVFHIINEQSRAKVTNPVAEVVQRGVIVGLANHTILVRKDGTETPIEDSAAPIRGEDGRMIGVVLVFHDVTQRRTLERELRERAENLVLADRRKDEFLGMLAHELRNPLAPLLTGSHLLRSTSTADVSIKRIGDMMERQIQHLSRLIDDLLDVSRITRGRIELSRERVSLRSTLERALEMVDPLMAERNHEVSVSLPPDSLCVYADATRLAQVFANLLENAAKFSQPAGQISLHAELVDDNAVVHVRDNGVGISAALLPKIFELFVQADKSLERSQGGLGLGLTVVKNLVQMHGGKVEVRSGGPDQGSEFIVCLPALSRLGSAKTSPDDESPGTTGPASGVRRVLIVDDNKDAALALAMLIRGWNHEVRLANTGPEALELGASFRPEVVLLDIGLPIMDGYEVARKLRSRPETAQCRLIALTGYGRDEDRRRSRAAGFDEHVIKPVSADVVRKLLDSDDN
ncbi:MAG: ATP-binding protein [Woeseia sp.]